MNTVDSVVDPSLSLYQLLDPAVLANPYPLFRRLREHDPVHWDPFLHAWIVTGYQDVITVLHRFSADRIRTPEQLSGMGCEDLNPIARVMLKQLLFMDPPSHTRLRSLAATAFSPSRIEALRIHIHEIAGSLVDGILKNIPHSSLSNPTAPISAKSDSLDKSDLGLGTNSFAQTSQSFISTTTSQRPTRPTILFGATNQLWHRSWSTHQRQNNCL